LWCEVEYPLGEITLKVVPSSLAPAIDPKVDARFGMRHAQLVDPARGARDRASVRRLITSKASNVPAARKLGEKLSRTRKEK